jgi:flagellar protein FlbD
MIKLNRLNNSELWVNAEMIEFIEETPDTVISLNNHTKLVVCNRADDIVAAIIAYRRQINAQPLEVKFMERQ